MIDQRDLAHELERSIRRSENVQSATMLVAVIVFACAIGFLPDEIGIASAMIVASILLVGAYILLELQRIRTEIIRSGLRDALYRQQIEKREKEAAEEKWLGR